jgi:hypothetical protein
MGELTRLEVLRDLDQRRLTTEAAGQLLGLERRHVFRLLKGVQGRGSDGSDLEATRSPEQPAQTGGASGQGVGDHPGALGGDGMTQFGRALHALNIDIICANSSQAKGRVERAHKTLQNRLVKELRLAGAATLPQGNALLLGFIAE